MKTKDKLEVITRASERLDMMPTVSQQREVLQVADVPRIYLSDPVTMICRLRDVTDMTYGELRDMMFGYAQDIITAIEILRDETK